jgi:hypothetical protein
MYGGGSAGGKSVFDHQKDWVVWEAEEEKDNPGVVRLLVTDKRYDKNPVYNGPRDNVITD